jgi:hypothetical protein
MKEVIYSRIMSWLNLFMLMDLQVRSIQSRVISVFDELNWYT